jgi:hypothetical protein
MKVLVSHSFNSNAAKRLLLVAIVLLCFVGCAPAPPAFTTGIRITADYRQAGVGGGGAVPVPGVVDNGNMQQPPLGPPGPGPQTDQAFIGSTNEFGIDDHPNARTNSVWTLTANFSKPLPQCGVPAVETIQVPPDGAIAPAHCVAF